MTWWRRRDGDLEDRWVAGTLLDEALRVFGSLQAAAFVEASGLDHELRERLRVTALDVLDDVACLAWLTGAGTRWPSVPREPAPADREEPLGLGAVGALADYTETLSALALVVAARRDETAATYARLAAAAEDRLSVLAS